MLVRWALLALLLAGLGGCSSVRLAYGAAPQLTWWWLDGYVDFSRDQSPAARRGLDDFFDWHRATQLPAYAELLTTAQADVIAPTTAALTCHWQDQVRQSLEPSLQRLLTSAADLLPGLGEAQFRSIEKRYAKGNEEMRGDFLQDDPAERLKASTERLVERAERVYGRLDDTQLRVVREGVAASPFDPKAWVAERQRRQRETLQVLRRLAAENADVGERLAALRSLAWQAETSPNPAYRTYQLKLRDYNCAFAARLHNATTAQQRQRAQGTLKNWASDLRALSAAAS